MTFFKGSIIFLIVLVISRFLGAPFDAEDIEFSDIIMMFILWLIIIERIESNSFIDASVTTYKLMMKSLELMMEKMGK